MPRDNDEPYSIPESRGVSFPIYLATPSGKPLKIKNPNDLKEEYTKVDKKYTELSRQKGLTPEQQRKLVLLRDDKEFLSQKLSEVERSGERPSSGFGRFFGTPTERQEVARDTRLAFPLSMQTPSGNRYEFESFEDLDRLENKEALEQEFNIRLGSTYNRKSREQIARELDSDLTAIRQKKKEVLDKGYYYAKPQKLYYPTGEEIPTLEEGVTEKTAGMPLAQEIIRLGKNIRENSEAYNTLIEKGNSAVERGELEEARKHLGQARNLLKLNEQDSKKKEYLETLGGEYSKYTLTPHNIEKRKQQFAEELGIDKPITDEDIAFIPAPFPEEATEISKASSSTQSHASESEGEQYKVDESGNVINVGRNAPVNQEKLRLAKIQEEASRIANLPFEENPYAKIAPQDIYEEVGQKNLSRLASKELEEESISKTEPKSIFPFEVVLPEDIKAANRSFLIKDQADLERVINKSEQKIKEYKEKNLLGNAENFQKALDIIKGTYQSLKVQSESPEATAIREQNIRSQKAGFEFQPAQHEGVVENYMYPRENEASQRYREAMEKYLNPDYMKSEYKTLKDELVGELRQKAMRRFNDSLKDLNWQHVASKMGRSGFFDQQRQKMFENVQNELNLHDKELGLQLYGQYEQGAANRAREAREGLNLANQQGASRATMAMQKDEIERQRALEAYKVNKLEEESRREKQRQSALDLIGLGRAKREHAQQGLNVQSAEFMRKQGYPQERLNKYADTVLRTSLGQPQVNLPEREQIFEPRMVPLPEPVRRERELEPAKVTAPVMPEPEAPSTAMRDWTGLALGAANVGLEYSKYKDQQAANKALADAAKAAATTAAGTTKG
jgi:hypothetical protein